MRKIPYLSMLKSVFPCVLMIILTLSSFLPLGSVFARGNDPQEETVGVYTLEDFQYRTDINFQGVLVDRIFNITFPENWEFNTDATLSIRFSHSPALDPISSMAVDWNDKRIASVLLTQENAQNGLLEISLPAESIQQGYNALQIEFYMGISEDFCIDFDNPAVWAVVHNNTAINVTPQIVPRETELSLAPEILIDSSLLAENQVTLIIPSDPVIQDLNALAVMATKLGQLADWRNTAIDVMTIEEAIQAQPTGNLVLIATVGQIQNFAPTLIPEIISALELYTNGASLRPPITSDNGLVFFQVSPFDPRYHILSLTGVTAEAVENSARAAAFDSLFEQSEGTWAVVRDVPEAEPGDTNSNLTISMESLGYEDITAFGTQEQTIQFNLPLSALWNIDSEAWLDLRFRHSQLLNRERSTLNIMVNSIPVASVALSPDNANNGYEEVRIPLRFLEVGENIITLQANMQFTDNVTDIQRYCTDDTFPRAWLTIRSDTAVRFPDVSEQTPLSLSNFPYGFTNPYSFEGFAYAIPADDGIAAFTALSDIAVAFGKAMLGNPADIDLLFNDNDFSQYEDYDHVVLIGTIQNLLGEELNSRLPLPIDLETGLLQTNNTVLAADTITGIGSYLQTFKDTQATIYLVVAANDPQGLVSAGKLLSEPGIRSNLDGNLAVVSAPNNASAYQVEPSGPKSDQQPQGGSEPATITIAGQSVWILRVAIGVLAISVVALVIALFRKDNRGGES